MSLKKRMMLFGGGTTLLLLLVAVVGVWGLSAVGGAVQDVSRSTRLLRAQGTADRMHDALRADVMSALFSASSTQGGIGLAAERELEQHGRQLLEAMQSARTLVISPVLRQQIEAAAPVCQAYVASARNLIQRAAGDVQGARSSLPRFLATFGQLERELRVLGDGIEREVAQAEAAATQTHDTIFNSLLGLTVGACAVLVSQLLFSDRSLLYLLRSEPVVLAGAMRTLPAGDLAGPPEERESDHASVQSMLACMQRELRCAVVQIHAASEAMAGRAGSRASATQTVSQSSQPHSEPAGAMAAAVDEGRRLELARESTRRLAEDGTQSQLVATDKRQAVAHFVV